VFFDGDDGPVGAAVLTTRTERHAVIRLRQVHLHTAGEPEAESAAVEHTGVLCDPRNADAVHAALSALIRARPWDEFILSGVSEATLPEFLTGVPGALVETVRRPTYTVDLATLRGAGTRYESVLSKSTRDQLKRTRKLYGERGEVTLTFAATLEDAYSQLDELAVLHRRRWEARGAPGAFSHERRRAFHERLIARAFPRGAVQLARVRVGDTTIGVLYNFVQDGAVAFYQSGFRYEEDNRLKPGNLTHAMVIQACLDRGLASYDFLASDPGGSRYKAALATDTAWLVWSTLRRPSRRTRAIAALRRVKRLVQERSR
jgi:CelD/BcsL family acetyltransferase involved in cellulose biosynthesis